MASHAADIEAVLSAASASSAATLSSHSSSASYLSYTTQQHHHQHHSSSSSNWTTYQSVGDNPNQCSSRDWAPAIPLDQYRLNEDPYPEIIRKKPTYNVHYQQNVAVRYLKPPAPAPAGDIVIKQLQDRQVAPAPALHIQRQAAQPATPPPMIIRENPPPPPAPIPGQVHYVPGKIIPPPARKVITEHLPPIPARPQKIIIDRWLPYEQPLQRVRYEPAKPACIIPDPRNVIIQWDAPEVQITQQFCNLGVHHMNPAEYTAKYGASLIHSEHLPAVALQFGARAGHSLAHNTPHNNTPILIGDVEYLRLIQQ